jgi:hypothetical protein
MNNKAKATIEWIKEQRAKGIEVGLRYPDFFEDEDNYDISETIIEAYKSEVREEAQNGNEESR